MKEERQEEGKDEKDMERAAKMARKKQIGRMGANKG